MGLGLRARARSPTYAGSFIEHWVQRVLYYDAPAGVFTFGYSLFGLAVLATWWYFPPRLDRRIDKTEAWRRVRVNRDSS